MKSLFFSSFIFICLFSIVNAKEEPDVNLFKVKIKDFKVDMEGNFESFSAFHSIYQELKETYFFSNFTEPKFQINHNVEFPSLDDLRSLIVELGISLLDGELKITNKNIVISGNVSSLISLSAITLKLLPLLKNNKKLVNNLELINEEKEDLLSRTINKQLEMNRSSSYTDFTMDFSNLAYSVIFISNLYETQKQNLVSAK